MKTLVITASLWLTLSSVVAAQFRAAPPAPSPSIVAEAGDAPPASQIVIADEPTTVDPATIVPPKLTVPVTVKFEGQSLKEIVKWLQDEQQIVVVLEIRAFDEAGIPTNEPLFDHLNAAPLYLLLNRLSAQGLAWYVEEDVVYITTIEDADLRHVTLPYNLGDLLDAGCQPDDLQQAIRSCTSGAWEDVGGEGGALAMLGDVAFIRQPQHVHREVGGLLAAMRNHGRRTFTLDPVQHEVLRQKLQDTITVDFEQTSLEQAVRELARISQIDIRLEKVALEDAGISVRSPVTLKLKDQPLQIALRVMLEEFGSMWILRDGAIWVTTREEAALIQKTAVFDVRDLCRDQGESFALAAALMEQTTGEWEETDGIGGSIEFPKPGVMVVRQTERGLDAVLQLLESYRLALKASRPRKRGIDPHEVVTRYYRLPSAVARDLAPLLPTLVKPESWTTEKHPDAPGQVLFMIASRPDVMHASSPAQAPINPKEPPPPAAESTVLLDTTVLAIRQTREVHDKLVQLVLKIEQGDSQNYAPVGGPAGGMGGGMGGVGMGGAGMGGMGGGFGGGFFSIQK